MVQFSSNPVEQQSPHGDGSYLLRMLLGQRTAPTPDMALPMEQQAVGPPQPLGAPISNDIYVDDPAANAEINPLASTQPITPPIPQARPGVSNMPQARPEVMMAQSLSQPAVSGIMDNMRGMLAGNSASAGPAINNIDGDSTQSGDDSGGWGWGDTAKATGIAALIAAILSGRGRSAGGVADASRGVTPYDPGRSGTILGRDQITDQRPTSPNINPNQIETDILNVSPDHSRFIGQDADNYWDRSAAGMVGDVEGANSPHAYVDPRAKPSQATPTPKPEFTTQGKPQSVPPDVINQSGPNVQRGLESQGVQYRGRTYYMDKDGNVTDRNGDIVKSSAVNEIKARFTQSGS